MLLAVQGGNGRLGLLLGGHLDEAESLIACEDAACTTFIHTVVAQGIGVNSQTSMASVSGLPAIAYWDSSSEDVIYMLHGMGIETGIDLDALTETALWISERLGRAPASKLGQIAWREMQADA